MARAWPGSSRLADHERPIRIVLKGLIGPVTVNGVTFNSAMPPLETTLAEQQIADVLTYVTGEWGNKGTPYSVDEVRRVKQELQGFVGLPKVAP
jgi:mono/diheme cytochrome c family protein